jgi:hypothetical protein
MPHTDTLSPAQIQHFQTEGYLRLPQAIEPTLLNSLRQLFDTIMTQDNANPDFNIDENNGRRFITCIANPCNKGDLSCFALLGHPFLLSVAQIFCGHAFVPIQDFAVIKNNGDGVPVLWHLDMGHHGAATAITMGIYLDDAPEGEGALRVVPRSHTSGKTICELQHQTHIEVPMQAGDVLVHDMMLAHSSGTLQHSPLRRVIYFEFLPLPYAIDENLYTPPVVALRTRLLRAAAVYYNKLYPAAPAFSLAGNPYYNEPVTDTIAELHNVYASPLNGKPSAYCLVR